MENPAGINEIKTTPPPPKESSSIKDQEPKPNFALDKWQYGSKESVTSLINTLSQGNQDLKAELETAFNKGGGKAFGLKICEMVAQNFSDPESSFKLTVPEWGILSNIGDVDPANHKGKILRSSTDDEDWVDPKSGVHRSYKFPEDDYSPEGYKKDSDLKAFIEDKRRGTLFEGHYIKQPIQEGFGLVVNVGYSKILEKPVIRISSGNLRGPMLNYKFTSAVSDTEASVGIWDSKGDAILPTRHYEHESLFIKNESFKNNFASRLFDALSKTGIDFGVQMEMVVNPDNPKDFRLVQLRPSPENMTKTIKNESEELTRKKELGIEGLGSRSILKSACVNGRFNVIAGSSVVKRASYIDGLAALTAHDWDGTIRPTLSEQFSLRKEGRGNIAIYDPVGFANKYDDTKQLISIYLKGADVLITPAPIKPNDNHGAIFGLNKQAYDLLDNCCMISVPRKQISELKNILTDKESRELIDNAESNVKMQVVSDGLIADIRVFEK